MPRQLLSVWWERGCPWEVISLVFLLPRPAWGSLGMRVNAVEMAPTPSGLHAAAGRWETPPCLFILLPPFSGRMLSNGHAQRRCEPRGCGPAGAFSCPRCDADSFSCRFSLQLKKLLLSPSHVPPSCEAQRDGSARRPGTPKSRAARSCTKVLPWRAELKPSAHLSGAHLKEVTQGRCWGVWEVT